MYYSSVLGEWSCGSSAMQARDNAGSSGCLQHARELLLASWRVNAVWRMTAQQRLACAQQPMHGPLTCGMPRGPGLRGPPRKQCNEVVSRSRHQHPNNSGQQWSCDRLRPISHIRCTVYRVPPPLRGGHGPTQSRLAGGHFLTRPCCEGLPLPFCICQLYNHVTQPPRTLPRFHASQQPCCVGRVRQDPANTPWPAWPPRQAAACP